MMLASEAGKESVRIMEMERMIRLDMTTSLGLGHVENLGAAAHHVMPSWAQQLRRPPPVQLDLLPMSRSSHDSVHETSTAEPAPDSSVTDRFSSLLEQTFLSRMDSCNEGSLFCAGNNNADGVAVETYSSGGGRGSSPRDIDMNQLPSTSDGDDEAVVSSPSCSIGIMTSNPSITTDQRDQSKWHVNMQLFDPAELQDMRGSAGGGCDLSSRRGSDDEADGSAATTRKKLRLSKEQSALLEDSFKDHSTLNPKQKNALAKQLNLRPRQVEVWFQNRRARTKLKQTEVDCEVLKRCCENLSEENRRLQKELQELRALKLAVVATTPRACTAAAVIDAHGFSYMQRPVLSAATLTMCPSCERVATVENRSAHITFPKPAGSSSSFSHFLQPSAAY
ncbi:unnamed protein product [Sphagnum troendelagicum]|uniref:Homeobox domain-containing protein n=2 Tax=Sphagnum TaxID=13804 RepID=A0ABP0TQX8_9BRYO